MQHNPGGTYAVDANYNYVPASRMELLWADYLTRQDQANSIKPSERPTYKKDFA